MKSFLYITSTCIIVLISTNLMAQHRLQINAELNTLNNTLNIQQEITFFNQSNDTLSSLILNDWNNAYSDKDTPLGKRFSDEFYRGFHLAKDTERGGTSNLTILNSDKLFLDWQRTDKNPDYIEVTLRKKLAPNEKVTLVLTYSSKIPSNRFTKFGYSADGSMNIKNWFISPARYENHKFVKYNNYNLDDIANGICNFEINLRISKRLTLTTDLNQITINEDNNLSNHKLIGNNRTDFSLFISPKDHFETYTTKNNGTIFTNLKDNGLDELQKNIIINRVTDFTTNFIGNYPHEKLIVSQTDYERNPVYGLNQLPLFMNPFSKDFLYEIKFLKTYLNAYLKNSLHLDPRKDNWIYDGIQILTMIRYIEKNYPNSKMLGRISNIKFLKNYNLTQANFNNQYSYFYMLMARKNLDQPLGTPKNELIKFNEQIANKYRAGLSLLYLDYFLENNRVNHSIQEFYFKNKVKQVSNNEFEAILKSNTNKNIDWFFDIIINSRKLIDYKFNKIRKTKDSVTFTLKSLNNSLIPVPVYGIKNDSIVFKKWIEPKSIDSVFTIERKKSDKIILNYNNEVPEYNLRNNWEKLTGIFPNDRPLKFILMSDLEDPFYNQVLYIPSLTYNYYDGLSPGIRLSNSTILDKPIVFSLDPSYSTRTNTLSGSANFIINQNNRNSNLFNVRYMLSGSYFHYAPDATYQRLIPRIELRIRDSDFRNNHKQSFVFRQVIVNKDKSLFVKDNNYTNYSVFDARYNNSKIEITNNLNISTGLQLSKDFGKTTFELEFNKLYRNNRQLNLRLYLGLFTYNNTYSDYFSFAVDRPSNYLFDYNYYGQSESRGIYSQQFIPAEGGFKSKLPTAFSNQWITAINGGFTIWNYFEIYGDLGLLKNKNQSPSFLYDSGIRLNLVPNYFELYFPIHSNNGFEVAQKNYTEKIRFVITFSPNTLINLFTRKWF